MKNFFLSCLFGLLVLILAFYASLLEGGLVWVLWNHMIASVWPTPPVSYLPCVRILTIINFIIYSYKALKFYRSL